jgi:hypothetical protein
MKCDNVLLVIIFVSLVGCSPKNHVTSPQPVAPDLREYIPLKVGNSWTYSSSTHLTNGTVDTSLSSLLELSVFQTNTLIGGQPNAFVMGTSDGEGQSRYLAFYLDATTLWHYLGGNITFPLQTNLIVWIPGGVGGAVVGVHQSQSYYVTDRSGNPNSFAIRRSSDPSVALVNMISQDTVQITGVSEGQTTFCLQRIGGTTGDTMTVYVESTNNPSPLIPFLRPWIPLWQLTNSSADQIVFSWDTTYSFRRLSDSSLCRDELSYLVTNRRVGEDHVAALNTSVPCEKFEMKITVTETVTSTNKLQARILYEGPSTYFVVDMWIANKIGFIKGTVDGASRFPGVTMVGNKDSNGVLQGYYISPRVSYAAVVGASTYSDQEYFHVDDTPLGPNSTSESFILTKKNF